MTNKEHGIIQTIFGNVEDLQSLHRCVMVWELCVCFVYVIYVDGIHEYCLCVECEFVCTFYCASGLCVVVASSRVCTLVY